MHFVLLPAQQQKPMFTERLKVLAFRYFSDPSTPRDNDIWQRDETLSAESSPPRLSVRLYWRQANTPTLTPPQHRLTSLVALRDQHDHQEEAQVASENSRRRQLLVFRHTTPAQYNPSAERLSVQLNSFNCHQACDVTKGSQYHGSWDGTADSKHQPEGSLSPIFLTQVGLSGDWMWSCGMRPCGTGRVCTRPARALMECPGGVLWRSAYQ